MPITIKSSRMQYRKSNGDYVGVDAVSERKTSEYVSAIESTGSATQSAIEQTASTARNAIDTKAQQARDSIPSDYTALSDDVSDLKSALFNLSDGNRDSMLHAKYYDGYYNATPTYTGTKIEGKTSIWSVCVIPVPIGKKITISGFRAQGGTNSCWLNSSDPEDVHSVAWQSSNNNGEKTCVTAWLGISDYNLLGNTNDIIANYAAINSINDRISAGETLSKYIGNKENLTPLYKADLVSGYFQADNGQYRPDDARALVNNRMYQFPFDVIIKDVPETISTYRVVTFSNVVPIEDSKSVFLTSQSYPRTTETTIPANTIFCVSVHANSAITSDAIDGMFIGWSDFEVLRSDADGLMEEMPLKADKTYIDGLVADKANIEYVNQQIENIDSELAQKANLTDISTPYNFKGSCTFANLPVTANINDTWYVTDREYKMTWNGSGWYQSSLSEADYEQNLSEIDEKLDYKDKQLFSTGAKPSCAVTFTDDDGHEEFYTIIRPICLAKNCKYTSAYVTGSANMTDAQLTQLQQDGLFEFISHSHYHIPPDNRTDDELRADFAASVAWLKAHNMNYHGYAAPGGNTNARTRRIIKEYFEYNLSGFSGISKSPLYQFDIPRVTLFAPNTTYDLSTYTAFVDKIYENGGWLVFIGHCWEEEFNPEMLEQLIDYIQAKGIDIISTMEGVEKYGNLIDLGDHSLQNDQLHEFLSVAVDGTVESSGGIILQNDKNVTIDTPVTYFPDNKVTCLTIANGSAFPFSQGGLLCTLRIAPLIKNGDHNDINSFQIWFPYYHQVVYKRRWNPTQQAWTGWTRISGNLAESSTNLANLSQTALTAGAEAFSFTLNKPIWRNAANNGWVDATGAAVDLT